MSKHVSEWLNAYHDGELTQQPAPARGSASCGVRTLPGGTGVTGSSLQFVA